MTLDIRGRTGGERYFGIAFWHTSSGGVAQQGIWTNLQTQGGKMESADEPMFVKVLETNSLTDIALIKSVLDGEGVRYFIQGENLMYMRPVDPAVLMVAHADVDTALKVLGSLKLKTTWISRD